MQAQQTALATACASHFIILVPTKPRRDSSVSSSLDVYVTHTYLVSRISYLASRISYLVSRILFFTYDRTRTIYLFVLFRRLDFETIRSIPYSTSVRVYGFMAICRVYAGRRVYGYMQGIYGYSRYTCIRIRGPRWPTSRRVI